MSDKLFIVGKPDIAIRLGCSKHMVVRYIKNEGLPAFRDTPNGPYKVTPDALKKWSNKYQEKQAQKTPVKGKC